MTNYSQFLNHVSALQKFQIERVNLQEVKRSNYDHTRKCTDQLLLLGQVCIASLDLLQLHLFSFE